MCSTFKLLAAAEVLFRADTEREDLFRQVAVQADIIIVCSPVTQPRAAGVPMTVAELCEAAVTVGYNTADNLLLRSAGGPQTRTVCTRSLGDQAGRLPGSTVWSPTSTGPCPETCATPLHDWRCCTASTGLCWAMPVRQHPGR